MSEAFDGEKIARERIAQEAERRTGFLDLGGLGLTTLPPRQYLRSESAVSPGRVV